MHAWRLLRLSDNQTILNVEAKNEKEIIKRGKRPGAVTFPRHPLKRAIVIAETIWSSNGGEPYDIIDVAKSVNMSPTSSSFITLLASSYRYGLTEGSPSTKVISLTDIGRNIVAPSYDSNVNGNIRKALLNSEVFRKVLLLFDRKPLPREDILKNTLMRPVDSGGFGIPKEDVNEFIKVFNQNIEDYDLVQSIRNARYLRLDNLAKAEIVQQETSDEQTAETSADIIHQDDEVAVKTQETLRPKVFISHSKNKKILDQIKQMLEFGEFDYEIAEEDESTSIPIPEKVFGLMRKCNCAVINVSADEQEKHDDGSYDINQNVLIEIGAAFLAYDRRVILLLDRRMQLPSNLQGLYLSYYEGDELSWHTGMKLQKALTEFRNNI